jgi:hypothetical protein
MRENRFEAFPGRGHIVVRTRYHRCGDEVQREAVVRLIIPTELRLAMGRRLMAGTANINTTAAAETAQLH